MKSIRKRFVALLLILFLFLNVFSVNSFATTDSATLSVDSKTGIPGDTVKVNISLNDNPGLTSLKFDVIYDDYLTLKDIELSSNFGNYITTPETYSNPQTITLISPLEDVTATGVLATLEFEIADNAPNNYVAEIQVEHKSTDVYNSKMEDVALVVTKGKISIFHGIPGDINADKEVTTRDAVLLFRYVAGWSVEVDLDAVDVTGDGIANTRDAVMLFRYVAGWDGIVLHRGKVCTHQMTATSAVEATCTTDGNTAYWYCSVCEKYFSDAEGTVETTLEDTVVAAYGHTAVVDSAVAPTYTTTGLTEGSHCAVCSEVLVKQEIVPVLQKETYSITYHIANNDTYLAGLTIENTNSDTYTAEDGLVLEDIMVAGYNFKGWYTAQTGGTLVTEIPAGSKGSKTLYAQWEKVEYSVTFDSPDVPVESVTYTVDKGVTLTNPSWFGYTFVGWSKDGKIVSSIEPGTTGNITLHANWTSNRNKAKAISKLAEPSIIEDLDNGRYLFVYEIGSIENVPLAEIEYIGNSQGITINNEYEYTQIANEKFVETIANTVSNATTKTSSWTLSEDWNSTTSASNEHEEEIGKTEEKRDSQGSTVGSQYYISNVSGGSTSSSSSAGGASSTSAKVTTGDSVGINSDYHRGSELDTSVDLSVEGSVGAEYGPVKAEVSAGVATNVSTHDEETFDLSNSRNTYIGTYDESNQNSYWDTSSTASSSWNTTNSYQTSSSTSHNTEVSNAISEVIQDRYSYTSTENVGGGSSETKSTDESQELTDEYVSTVEYSTEERSTVKKSIVYSSDATGYYRLVTAGTVHVFAVVGYDIATNSYFTYTYNVLDEERHEYLDYSKDNANFDDCENAVLPFEVPYEVHEFVTKSISRSQGLTIDMDSGYITEYDGTAEYVVIPEYVSVNNGDGTYSAIRVRGFDEDVFKGNTSIKAVALPKYISAIPDSAFEGCVSLETVFGYGIAKIGDKAFSGCTSLDKFTVDKLITEIGTNAFDGVAEVEVMAANAAVADAAIDSGAKRITLNISEMTDSYDNKKIDVSDEVEYFAFISNGSSYSDLQIESDANETFISNIKFVNNTDTPLKLNSAKVTLNRVTVENAPGFALILTSDNTELDLFGTIALTSQGDNAVISKNVALDKANSEVAGKLSLTGNYLVCGEITNDKLLSFNEGEIITISEEEYNSYLTSSVVTFDANGGSVAETTKTVYYGQLYDELPVPTREHYSFLGWFTEADGGTEVTAETSVTSLVNQTLYAHWSINAYKVNFNANGGSVSTANKQVESGSTYGELPTPTRTGWTFKGWYTAQSGGTQITSGSTVSISGEQTLYARWQVNSYTAKWSTGTGYSITVKRTASPNAGAETKNLSSGDPVHYGDVLSVTYTASTGYSITEKGATSITVTGNVTSSNIYASASANNYTYTILYRSTNGTDLGSSSATYKYGTTNTISAPAKTGYSTPSSQSVAWNATSKTITFYYTPNAVATIQNVANGTWWYKSAYSYINYSANIEYQNRTASSVQVRVIWTNTISSGAYYGYDQYYNATIGGVGTSNITLGRFSSSSSSRTLTVGTEWVTVPVSATQTSVSMNSSWWDQNSKSGSWTATFSIPVY